MEFSLKVCNAAISAGTDNWRPTTSWPMPFSRPLVVAQLFKRDIVGNGSVEGVVASDLVLHIYWVPRYS